MGKGAQNRLPDSLQELAPGGPAGEVDGQDQGVDEEADEVLALAPSPVGDQGANP